MMAKALEAVATGEMHHASRGLEVWNMDVDPGLCRELGKPQQEWSRITVPRQPD